MPHGKHTEITVKSQVPDENEVIQIAEHSARGGYYLFIGNTLSTGILAISSIIIARLLGPADYGLFSLSIVVPSLLIGLIDVGITSAITRFSAKLRAEDKNPEVESVIRIGFFFELAVGIIASIFCFIHLTLLPMIGVLNFTDMEIFRNIFHKNKTVWPILKRLLFYEAKILKYIQKLTR